MFTYFTFPSLSYYPKKYHTGPNTKSLATNEFPNQFKIGRIIATQQSRNTNLVESYRLMPSKIFEKVIHSH